MKISELIKARFWTNVSRKNDQECWNWESTLNPYGYGLFYISKRCQWTANRFVWETVFSPIPDGLCVLHKCDNRKCCNPFHLYVGTRADNCFDAIDRGRNYVPKLLVMCRKGLHKLEGDNIIRWKMDKSKFGFTRVCRACREAGDKLRKAKALTQAREVKG